MSLDNVGAELQQIWIGMEVTAANMAFEEKGHSGGQGSQKGGGQFGNGEEEGGRSPN